MQQRSVKSEVEEKTSRKENNERRILIFVRLILTWPLSYKTLKNYSANKSFSIP